MPYDVDGARPRLRGGWRAAVVVAGFAAASAAEADIAGDAAAGKRVFARCQSCHQVGPTARNLIGPELNGLVGRTSGAVAGYAYSPALKSAAIVWDHETITAFVASPQSVVKGTRMASPGRLQPSDLVNLVAYLATFSADGTPSP